jgi:hypothetical protein
MSNDLTATLPASARTNARPSLTVMLVLHSVFVALRGIFVREAGEGVATRLDELIALGHLKIARSFLAPYAIDPLDPHPDRVLTAIEVASRALCTAIDTALLSAPVDNVRRVFYARVELLGRQDLGVCRVHEEKLGGGEMLRLELLESEGCNTQWVKASSCYRIAEMSERAAHEAADAALQRHDRDRERAKKREAEESRVIAEARAIRATCPVIMRTWAEHEQFIVFAHKVGAIDYTHGDIAALLGSCGFERWNVDSYRVGEGTLLGFRVTRATPEQRDELFEGLATLGFASVEREVVVKPDSTPDANDCDDESEGV